MKLEKNVTTDLCVEVEIGIEDIAFAVLEGREKSKPALLRAINDLWQFIEAMPDEMVEELNEQQAKVITDFFEKQLARFKNITREESSPCRET